MRQEKRAVRWEGNKIYEGSSEARCSVSGRACKCGARGGCSSNSPRLDPPTTETVRWLRSARLYLDAAKVAVDSALGGEEQLVRKYPAPEIREIRRKVVTAIAMIDEIGGDL
jgi:hypothetical protein